MDVEAIDDVDATAECFGSDESIDAPNPTLWFGREVRLLTDKHNKIQLLAQFFFSNLKQMEDILNAQSKTHRYHLLALEEEILEEISLNIDQYADYAYFSAAWHPSNRAFALLDPKDYQRDIIQCKNLFKSICKGVKKTEKAIEKGVKKGAKKVAKFVKEHKTEILIGAAIVAAAVGVYYVSAALAATAEGISPPGGSGRRREDEADPEPVGASDPPPPEPIELESLLTQNESTPISRPNSNYFPLSSDKSNPSRSLDLGPSFTPPSQDTSILFQPKFFNPNSSSENPTNANPSEASVQEKKFQFQNGVSSMDLYKLKKEDIKIPLNPKDTPSLPPSQQTSFLQAIIANFLQREEREIERVINDPSVHSLAKRTTEILTSPKSCHIETEGVKYSFMKIGFINGMNTTFKEAQAHLEYIRKFTGEMGVEGVYNHSNTAAVDMLEIFSLNFQGVALRTADLLIENWTQFHEENKNNPNAKYFQITHSMGTILAKVALEKAPQEIRDRVIIAAFGPAVIIPRDLCYDSFHFCSKEDIVHLGEDIYTMLAITSLEGLEKMEFVDKFIENKDRLILLDPHPDYEKGIDHDFQTPTYYPKLGDIIGTYLKAEGQY